MTRCRSCGKEIVWVITFSGKRMPVDAGAVSFIADSGKEIFVTSNGAVVHGTRIEGGSGRPDVRTGYISHFATCPNADQHRKPRK